MFQPTSKITAYDTTKAYTLSVGELTGNGALAGASVNIMDVTSQRMLIGDYQKLYIGLATKTNSGSASSY